MAERCTERGNRQTRVADVIASETVATTLISAIPGSA
jgi:hypothetical protein